jgi:hypothetical protein
MGLKPRPIAFEESRHNGAKTETKKVGTVVCTLMTFPSALNFRVTSVQLAKQLGLDLVYCRLRGGND